MNTKKLILKIWMIGIFMFFASFVVNAQVPQSNQSAVKADFEDEEIEKFVEVNTVVIEVQKKAQDEAMVIIEENDLDLQRFNEIVAIQQGKSEEEATPEELASFNQAAQEIMKNNQETQAEIIELLDENEVDQKTYQQMMMAYQQDEEFRAKVDKIVQEKSKG
ncbi:hypothetical protein GCM10011506_26060 [Marivirga lumbricoides]|uniref:DUF4168 domain-containing protein n=1 Tax=Marivirga lumbricoides TaxID=1046115 RepID=A0ABQ1MGG0_9BACT|nr:hypothetical protein GCM10011506_26060 [Marivirga lumbricoides]